MHKPECWKLCTDGDMECSGGGDPGCPISDNVVHF